MSNQPEISTFGTWNVKWSPAKGQTAYGSNQFSVTSSLTIDIDLEWDPSDASISVGWYDRDNKKFVWASTQTGGATSGSLSIETPGTYSFAVRNNSTGAVTITGSYTV